MSADEVGDLLYLKKTRVYELAAAGLLPTVRLGRRILFSRRGIAELERAAIARTLDLQERLATLAGQA
jgi:excisionase family DNA binding protein